MDRCPLVDMMPRNLYSYRLGRVVAMLTDAEFEAVDLHLRKFVSDIKTFRREKGCSLKDARELAEASSRAMDVYEELTGSRLDTIDQLHAVQASRYGRPCPACSKPFRTPTARFCAECGFSLPEGETAGGCL